MSNSKAKATQIAADTPNGFGYSYFSLEVPTTQNGTLLLGRGLSNSTTSTIFSVDVSNNVTFSGTVSSAGFSATSITGLTTVLPISEGGTNDNGSVWTSTSVTITAGSGTIGAATGTIRYKFLGKTVFFNLSVTVTSVGSASAYLIVSGLPFITPTTSVATGREAQTTGALCTLTSSAGTNTAIILTYVNSFPISTTGNILFDGVWETT